MVMVVSFVDLKNRVKIEKHSNSMSTTNLIPIIHNLVKLINSLILFPSTFRSINAYRVLVYNNFKYMGYPKLYSLQK